MEADSRIDPTPGTRVLVAMSGGVDSSVAAHRLVRAGMDVIGVTMRLVDESIRPSTGAQAAEDRACCSLDAAEDARRVASSLGITHYMLNLADLFEGRVVRPSRAEYARGRTPNPCIMCNRYMKFDVLFTRAEQLGCEYVATGHDAGMVHDSDGWHLLRGADDSKDQSYFLAFLTDKELPRILFPLGADTKKGVREEAAKIGLKVSDRPDSQDLCFNATGDTLSPLGDDIERGAGEIVLSDGTVIGTHEGIHNYTRGQRKGLPGGMHEPLYVVDIDAETNRVIVGIESQCYGSSFTIEDVSLVSSERDTARLEEDVEIRVRYRTKGVAGRITLLEGKKGEVALREPVRAIAPGQAAVWYSGDEVLGAGIISDVQR